MPFQNRASCREPAKIEGKGANTKRDLKKVAQICALTLNPVKQRTMPTSVRLGCSAGDASYYFSMKTLLSTRATVQ